jgi:hypothetical protein
MALADRYTGWPIQTVGPDVVTSISGEQLHRMGQADLARAGERPRFSPPL